VIRRLSTESRPALTDGNMSIDYGSAIHTSMISDELSLISSSGKLKRRVTLAVVDMS